VRRTWIGCATALAFVVIAWLGAKYFWDVRSRGFGLLAHLQIRSGWKRPVLVLVYGDGQFLHPGASRETLRRLLTRPAA
jgi:hypothetical protein